MTSLARLTHSQIVLMRSLYERGGSVRPISVKPWQREIAVPLWRRDLIEVWFRQSTDHPSPRGPFFALTISGTRIASSFFNPAPRGLSGAEHDR